MPVVPFIADSPADALARIRAELGDDAVVVNVRKLPADGLKRLWVKPRIEVVAWAPDAKEPVADDLAELREELVQIREQLQNTRVESSSLAPACAAGELPAGMYFVRMRAPGADVSRRVVVVK